MFWLWNRKDDYLFLFFIKRILYSLNNIILTNIYISFLILKFITSHNNFHYVFLIIQVRRLRLKDSLWFCFDTTQFEKVGWTSNFIPFQSDQSTFSINKVIHVSNGTMLKVSQIFYVNFKEEHITKPKWLLVNTFSLPKLKKKMT